LTSILAACSRSPSPPDPAPLPKASGTLALDGLMSPVTIVRDRWGIPHIYAASPADLFFAQGFVQAQDRLFQMDLWRRSSQGRLSEVLGANFVERDAMTRRVQYRGDMAAEWASYGDDTRAIATAFVRGVNAWVEIARREVPEDFRLAGWLPERWSPEDLVNRTDAFLTGGNGDVEVFRARLAAAVGVRRADALVPPDSSRTVVPRGVDVSEISYVVAEALKRVGAAPIFSGFAAPFAAGSNAWAVGSGRSATGKPLLAFDPHRPLTLPALRYLVHLKAPGWNVIGATAPWLPGVAMGHNERLAWGMTALAADVQDIYVEQTNPDRPHQVNSQGGWVATEVVKDPIAIKRRQKVFDFEREYSSHGVLIASDRERNRAFMLRWTGFEPGTAAELAALAIDRAESETALLAAAIRWKLPASTIVYADVEGRIGSRRMGWVPVRHAWNGELPASGWTGDYEWQGWRTLSEERDAPLGYSSSGGVVISANDSVARTRRLADLFDARDAHRAGFDVADFERIQLDTLSWNAQQLVPMLSRVSSDRSEIEKVRRRLLAWDRTVTVESTAAAMYVQWEGELRRRLAEAAVPALRDELAPRLGNLLLPALIRPSSIWFDREPVRSRDALLVDALAAVVGQQGKDRGPSSWGQLHAALFAHPLAITTAARARFNVGPFQLGGYADTVMSSSGADLEAAIGPSVRAIIDVGNWDRSVIVSAPGQSEAWRSPHYADLARIWSAGEYVPLSFSDAAVQAYQEATLVLTPLRR
jgi:penicillin amidase